MSEDYLEQDDSIPGQKYACLSFLSPEKVLKDKNIFFLHSFLKDSFKDVKLTENELVDKYKDYLFKKEEELEEKFYEKNEFRTTVRGIKVRGVYDTIQEAKHRSNRLQKKDPNFNVYVGQVGFWLPWDPESHKIEDEQYAEEQLNQLMSEYKKNKEHKDEMFEQDKRNKINKMKQETEEKKLEQQKLEEQKKLDLESDENKEKIKEGLENDDPWIQRQTENEKIPDDLPELEGVESNDTEDTTDNTEDTTDNTEDTTDNTEEKISE